MNASFCRFWFGFFTGIFTTVIPALLCGAVTSPAWIPPEAEAVRTELTQWQGNEAELPTLPSSGTALLDEVIKILRQSSEPIKKYFDVCDSFAWQELPFGQSLVLPQTPLQIHVGDSQTKYLYGSLRYYLAIRLVQARLFDEAKTVLEELTPENSIDPAGVLLTKAVVAYHLADRKSGIATLKEFQSVNKQEIIPRRYTELAKHLQFELEERSEEEESKNISQQMDDVRRRLGKGRTDDGTQEAEDGVLKSLDKLIEKIEEQAKKQSQQGDGGQSNNPADDSKAIKQKAPGNVDRRDFSQGENWGGLPPKDRDEALLKIEKEFPAYYRDIIEQYFREMAK